MSFSLPENARILVTRTDRIGDLVISTSVFEALKKKYPKSHLAACVFREHRELVENHPFVDEVILYEKKGREKNWLGQFYFSKKIRAKKFDAVIHLHATNRMHGMSWLAGIPVRIGYDRRAAWALTFAHPYDKKEGRRHESDYLRDFLIKAGFFDPSVPMAFPSLPVSAENDLSVCNLMRHAGIHDEESIAVIHPSASDETKMWPAEKFAQLLLALGAAHPHGRELKWIAVGDAKAAEQVQKIRALLDVPVLDLCGALSLGMLAALFQKAKLVISNDSGPAHIAAAVGAPTVSIFGRWQPGLNAERWRPLGENVAIVKPEISGIPESERKFSYTDEISVEQVLKACMEISDLAARPEVQGPRELRNENLSGLRRPVSGLFRRVLVVQPYGLGDMLFITPVLRALRLIPTVEKVDLLIGSRTRALIQANPHVNDVIVIDKDKMHGNSFSQNFKFVRGLGKELKKNKYDLLLDYSIRGEYAFAGQFFLNIPRRAGYSYKNRAFFHNVRIPIPDGFQWRHAVDYACDLAERAGVPVRDRFLEFFFSENQRKTFKLLLNPLLPPSYFTVSLGGGESWGQDAHLKRWGVKRFAALAQYFLDRKIAKKILLVGSEGEKELAEEFLKLGLPAEDMTGKLSIAETAWVIQKSKFFLGNDGGLLHLARAVFKPVIGIYGPADPAVYGPYPAGKDSVAIYEAPADGKPRYFKFRYDKNDRSLQGLSVEEAVRQVESSKFKDL